MSLFFNRLIKLNIVLTSVSQFVFSELPPSLGQQNQLQQQNQKNHQDQHHSEFPIIEELKKYSHHPVTTTNKKAAEYFNQGLLFLYAFNQDAAQKSFLESIRLDPNFAMGYMGMALSLRPVLSVEIKPEDEKFAAKIMKKAKALSTNVSPAEKEYIDAVDLLFTEDDKPDFKKLAENYFAAMKKVVDKYPEDLDATAFLGEAYLNLHAENLWDYNGKPVGDTQKIVEIIENGLRLYPEHLGLNHFYIHLVENSSQPEVAWRSAKFVSTLPHILSHLVHTATHIYIHLGNYKECVDVNHAAINGVAQYREKYSRKSHLVEDVGHYYIFLSRIYCMANIYDKALDSASKLRDMYIPHAEDLPMMEYFYSLPLFVNIRFGKYYEILNTPKPSPDMKLSTILWNFSRAIALKNFDKDYSEREKSFFEEISNFKSPSWSDKASEFLINYYKGRVHNRINSFEKAVELQDTFRGEDFPFNWIIDSKVDLANFYLEKDNEKAEKLFREDLKLHGGSIVSLQGLIQALKNQNKTYDSEWVEHFLDYFQKLNDEIYD